MFGEEKSGSLISITDDRLEKMFPDGSPRLTYYKNELLEKGEKNLSPVEREFVGMAVDAAQDPEQKLKKVDEKITQEVARAVDAATVYQTCLNFLVESGLSQEEAEALMTKSDEATLAYRLNALKEKFQAERVLPAELVSHYVFLSNYEKSQDFDPNIYEKLKTGLERYITVFVAQKAQQKHKPKSS